MTNVFGGIGRAFSDRNFRIYSVGSIISWTTYFIQNITFSWLAWDLTHSTTWLAIVSSATTITTILLLPLGGVLADRHDRFRILMIAYGVDWMKTAILAALALTGQLSVPLLCVSAVAHGIIHSFSIPANYGLLPRFVSKDALASAIGVSAAYTQLAIFAGPALAGWILVHWGAGPAFVTNTIGYLVYFWTAACLRTPEDYAQGRSARASIKSDFTDGMRYIAMHRGLSTLLMLVLCGDAIAASLNAMMPAYTTMILELGAGTMATMFSAAGLGATAAALWLAYGGLGSATPVAGAVGRSRLRHRDLRPGRSHGAGDRALRDGDVRVLRRDETDRHRLAHAIACRRCASRSGHVDPVSVHADRGSCRHIDGGVGCQSDGPSASIGSLGDRADRRLVRCVPKAARDQARVHDRSASLIVTRPVSARFPCGRGRGQDGSHLGLRCPSGFVSRRASYMTRINSA